MTLRKSMKLTLLENSCGQNRAWLHGSGSAASAGQSALPVTRRAPSIVASHAAKPIVNAG